MKAKFLAIVVGIIALGLIIGGGYIQFYGKSSTNPPSSTKTPTNTKKPTPTKDGNTTDTSGINIKELDITDENITKLYQSIQLNEENFYSYYEQEKVFAKDLPLNIKLKIAAANITQQDQVNPIFPESDLKKSYETIFGTNNENAYKFEEISGNTCPKLSKTEDGQILFQNQCGTFQQTTQRQIYKAMQSGNEIYIYEVVAFHKFMDYNRSITNIYSDFQRTQLVLQNAYKGNNPLEFTGILEHFNDLPQYKYIFKLDPTTKQYFLYSVEKVKYL